MKRALVFGATGQDGSYMCEHLVSLGYEVTGTVRRNPQTCEWAQSMLGKMTFVFADIVDSLSVNAAIRKANPDEIYNLAGQTFSPTSWDEPYETMRLNAGAVGVILQAIERLKPDARFFQASACEMFGYRTGKVSESTPFAPISPYGASKVAAHHLVQMYRKRGLWACCGIMANHESPRRGSEMLTKKVAKAVAQWSMGIMEPLKLGNMHSRRDWNYAEDMVWAMHSMLQIEEPDDFVLGSGESHSVEAVLSAALESCKCRLGPLNIDNSLVRKGESTDCYVADASKAIDRGIWLPTQSLRSMMGLMVRAEIARIPKGGIALCQQR